jgi:hypothetical protein
MRKLGKKRREMPAKGEKRKPQNKILECIERMCKASFVTKNLKVLPMIR